MLPRNGRRRILTVAAGLVAPRPDRPAPMCEGGAIVAGELDRASGLGEAARLQLAALRRLGIEAVGLSLSDRRGAVPPIPPRAPLLLHVNSPQTALALLRLPRGLVRGRRVIGCWAWELPTLPPAWRAGVPFVHEVWALSRFTQAALEPLLPGRVRLVHPPVAAAPPRPSALDRAAFGLPADAVVTLVSFNLASSFVRKNPLAAIAAHRQAFGGRADRILLLKVGNPHHFPADFAALRAAAEAPNIRLETRTLPDADRHALTCCADIVLSLHRSEGFGLVPAEAMLLGRPVIATGWSGNMDFMDSDSAALVGSRLVPAIDPRGVFEAPGALWAEPDIAAAAVWLRRLADDAALRTALGARGQAMARRRLGTEGLTTALAAIGVAAAPVAA
jgi:glycosyltransferase involved in cell wall biosynthesis